MRTKSKKTWEMDSAAIEFLREHKGKENKVSANMLKKHLRSLGYDVKDPRCIIIRVMQERNAPICSAGRGGYWWAASREDIETAISDAESRIAAYKERIKFYESFILD